MLTWLFVQLGALALAAMRIPLAAAYPQPAEHQAVQILLIAQFAWATMLFPALLRTWGMAMLAACSACVLLILAAALAAWPIADVAPVAAYLSLWILVLTTLRTALSWKWQLIASAVAAAWIVGGPLLAYLNKDFGSAPQAETGVGSSPLSIALSMPRALPRGAWWCQVGIMLLICAGLTVRHFRESRGTSVSRTANAA